MNKKLRVALIVSAVLFTGYSIAWYVTMSNTASDLNKQYADKNLESKINYEKKDNQGKSDFSLQVDSGSKFGLVKVRPTGFPFKWAIAVEGIYNIYQGEKAEFQSPVIIGYDVLAQNVFIKYTGDIIIKNGSGVNNRIEDIASESTFRVGTYNFVKTLIKSQNKFELVNYLGLVTLNIKNLKWYNEKKTEKYYDLDHITFEVTFDKPYHYINADDFLNHPPHNGSFYASMKSNENQGLPLPGELAEFNDIFKSSASDKIKLNFKNEKDLEIDLVEFRSERPSLIKSFISGSLKVDKRGGVKVDIISEDEIGKNYFGFLKVIFNSVNLLLPKDPVLEEIQFILNNPKNFYLNQFENRKYDLALKAETKSKNGQNHLEIEHFKISSGRSSIHLKNDAEFGVGGFKAKGILGLNNFPKLIDISSGYILRYFKIFEWSDTSQAIIAELGKNLLRTISDHPESKSDDLSLTYDINSNNLMHSKIGNVEFAQLENLYYLALYRANANKIKLDDKIMDKLGKIIPGFNEQIKAITPNDVEEIIKKPNKIFNKNILKQLPK